MRVAPRRCRSSAGCTRCSTGLVRRPGLRGARPGARRPRPREPLRRRHGASGRRGERRPAACSRSATTGTATGRRSLPAAPQIDAEVTGSSRAIPRPRVLPGNVRWEPADWHRRLLSDAEVREAFRSAAVVVVPVKDVPQPSGQSVTLQASACGRPVVLTRTRGLWDPEALRDGENVLLVPPADPDALAAAVEPRPRRPVDAPSRSDARRGRPSRRRRASRATRRGCSRSARRRAPVRDVDAVYGTRSMALRTKPRAALVHARSALGHVTARVRTERDLRAARSGRADVAIFHDYAPPPSGGGNQFIRALEGELRRRGLTVEENRISGGTHACLFNSFNFDLARLRRFVRDDVRLVHRVDGPIGTYRGFDDGTDARIAAMNAELAHATVCQSRFSLDAHRRLGIALVEPVVITNAPDPAIFHPPDEREPLDGRPLRVVAASWSDNPRKGSRRPAGARRRPSTRARFELTFVGRARRLAGWTSWPLGSRARRAPARQDCYVARASTTRARTRCSRRSRAAAGALRRSGGHPSSSARAASASTARTGTRARTRSSRPSPAGCRRSFGAAAGIRSSSARAGSASTGPGTPSRRSTGSQPSSRSGAPRSSSPRSAVVADRYLEVLRGVSAARVVRRGRATAARAAPSGCADARLGDRSRLFVLGDAPRLGARRRGGLRRRRRAARRIPARARPRGRASPAARSSSTRATSRRSTRSGRARRTGSGSRTSTVGPGRRATRSSTAPSRRSRRDPDRFERVQVTHREMEELVVSAGVAPERVHRIPIGIELDALPARRRRRGGGGAASARPPARCVRRRARSRRTASGFGDGLEPKTIKGPDVLVDALAHVARERRRPRRPAHRARARATSAASSTAAAIRSRPSAARRTRRARRRRTTRSTPTSSPRARRAGRRASSSRWRPACRSSRRGPGRRRTSSWTARTGCLVDVEDAEALAAGLLRVRDDARARRAAARGGPADGGGELARAPRAALGGAPRGVRRARWIGLARAATAAPARAGRGSSPAAVPHPGLRVFYGWDAHPGPGEPVAGGTAKLQKLAERWPNDPTGLLAPLPRHDATCPATCDRSSGSRAPSRRADRRQPGRRRVPGLGRASGRRSSTCRSAAPCTSADHVDLPERVQQAVLGRIPRPSRAGRGRSSRTPSTSTGSRPGPSPPDGPGRAPRRRPDPGVPARGRPRDLPARARRASRCPPARERTARLGPGADRRATRARRRGRPRRPVPRRRTRPTSSAARTSFSTRR